MCLLLIVRSRIRVSDKVIACSLMPAWTHDALLLDDYTLQPTATTNVAGSCLLCSDAAGMRTFTLIVLWYW